MVLHILSVRVSPTNRINAVRTIQSILGPTRCKKGCEESSLYDLVDNDDRIMLFERWASQKDLERHLQSKHYRLLIEVLELSIEEPRAEILYVNDIEGLGDILGYRDNCEREFVKGQHKRKQ